MCNGYAKRGDVSDGPLGALSVNCFRGGSLGFVRVGPMSERPRPRRGPMARYPYRSLNRGLSTKIEYNGPVPALILGNCPNIEASGIGQSCPCSGSVSPNTFVKSATCSGDR